jgi:hypothetical protein
MQHIPFPVCKAQLIGDWYENRRGAPNTIIFLIFRQYYWRTDAPCANRSGGPKKKKKLLASCVWSALPIGGEGHRCANILADRCPPPLLLADRTQKMQGNVRILSRQDKKNKKRRTEQFGALRLFSSQSPINLALQTGNGNTLKKRRRPYKKLNRHRSPRSETNSSLLPDLPLFSFHTTFKEKNIISSYVVVHRFLLR